MSATAAPFGFRVAKHPSGQSRATPYVNGIISGYGTNLFRGSPVSLDSSNLGTLIAGTTTSALVGIFAGVEYLDAQLKPNESSYWPASQVATNVIAYVYDDPLNILEAQTDGTGTTTAAVEQTYIGGQMNCVNPTAGSTFSGQSTAALGASTLVTSGSVKQFRIVSFAGTLAQSVAGAVGSTTDIFGDAFLTLQCQISNHQYVATINAV